MKQEKRNEKLERIVKPWLVSVVGGCGLNCSLTGETTETRGVKTIKKFKETRDY